VDVRSRKKGSDAFITPGSKGVPFAILGRDWNVHVLFLEPP
jgi:hypothetical protein